MLNLGFIGFGEAASQISLGLSDNKNVTVNTYDILLSDDTMRPLLEERALTCSASCIDSLADLAADSEIIFSAVTSSVALKVAEAMAPYLTPSHIYVDLNAITPQVSKQIAVVVEKTGADYVDGAMMGSLTADKHQVPILASGKGVDRFMEKVIPLGFKIESMGDEPGRASGNKLVRSIFTKGLAALLIETLVYARELGYYDVVLKSVMGTMRKDPAQLVPGLVKGTMVHSKRRLGEMSGSRDMLQQAGLESKMIEGTIQVLEKIENLDLDKGSIPDEIGAVIEMLSSQYLKS